MTVDLAAELTELNRHIIKPSIQGDKTNAIGHVVTEISCYFHCLSCYSVSFFVNTCSIFY